jgi:hypothetical protein
MGVSSQALHGAKVCLIPRPENNYRPLVLRRGPLAIISGLIVTAKVLAIGLALILPATAELSTITSSRIIQLTNEERIKNGLGALQENASLSKAAAGKAKDIIDNDYFAHISPSGVTPWFWIQQQGYSYSVAGENLAIDFVQAEDVVSAWMASPGHKENILQPDYTETGMAVLTGDFQGGTSTIVVHMFGLPTGVVRPSQSSLSARAPITEEVAPALPESSTPPKVIEPVAPTLPEIKLLGDKQIFRNSVELIISGDVSSTIKIAVNGQETTAVTIKEGGYLMQEVDLTAFDDGQLQLSAHAVNESGVSSAKTTAIKIGKDTAGPDISDKELMFIVSPSTDSPHVLMFIPAGEYEKLSVEQTGTDLLSFSSPLPTSIDFEIGNNPIEVTAYDELQNPGVIGQVNLQPAIFSDRNIDYGSTTIKINSAARRLAMIIGSLLFISLLLAILIKVRIQHPQMITHASLVILLAVVLLFI